ncbi:MAG: CBS domain-containing protein, partial [Pseudomonadota bacterium]
MSPESRPPPLEFDLVDDAGIYNHDGSVRAETIDNIESAIDGLDTATLRNLVRPLHESELGDLLEALDQEHRQSFVELTGEDFDFAALTEVDEAIRLEIVDALPNEQIAEGFKELDSDDAVYILEDMEEADQEDVLAKVPFQDRVRLRRSLDYPEETAGRRMQTEFVAVPPFWTVGQVIDHLRDDQDLPQRFSEIFLIEPTFKLAGTVALDRLLRTQRETSISDIQNDVLHSIDASVDQEEAALVFEQYDLLSAPVVDSNERLVGVLTIDDVVDVLQEEA